MAGTLFSSSFKAEPSGTGVHGIFQGKADASRGGCRRSDGSAGLAFDADGALDGGEGRSSGRAFLTAHRHLHNFIHCARNAAWNFVARALFAYNGGMR